MHKRSWAAIAALGGALTACGGGGVSVISLAHGHLQVRGSEVTITRSGAPDAQLSAGGGLRIGGQDVALSAEQRAQVERYYGSAIAIRGHALETGKAGAEVGATAAKEVVSGVLHGDTSQIGAKVEAKAEEVKRIALGLCNDIAAIRDAQQALTATLEAFKPYAVVDADEVSDCSKDLKRSPAP